MLDPGDYYVQLFDYGLDDAITNYRLLYEPIANVVTESEAGPGNDDQANANAVGPLPAVMEATPSSKSSTPAASPSRATMTAVPPPTPATARWSSTP